MIKKLIYIMLPVAGFAQGSAEQVNWEIHQEWVNDSIVELTLNAEIAEGWHMYGSNVSPDIGPIPTTFYWDDSIADRLQDSLWYSEGIEGYDDAFMADLSYYEDSASFKQTVVIPDDLDKTWLEIEFMVCGDGVCLPPDVVKIPLYFKKD